MKGKLVAESRIVMSSVMMPVDANHYGSVHGGTILRLVDEAALVVASKHSRRNVVLASMDHMVFKYPVNIGDMLNIKAELCYVGESSMEVEVDITSERLKDGETFDIGSAYLTMVALDDNGSPVKVPRLLLKTKQDKLKSKKALNIRKKRLGQ